MIESTRKEQLAYCLSIVHYIELVEEQRKRQSKFHAWLNLAEVKGRIMQGLHGLDTEVDDLMRELITTGKIEVHSSGTAIRPMRNRGGQVA